MSARNSEGQGPRLAGLCSYSTWLACACAYMLHTQTHAQTLHAEQNACHTSLMNGQLAGTCLPSSADGTAVEHEDVSARHISLMQTQLHTSEGTKQRMHPYEYPWQLLDCPLPPAKQTEYMTVADYDNVVASVHRAYFRVPSTCDATGCPQADWAGCVLRAAAHDFMDYGSGQGGADGCIAFQDDDNKGLTDCLFTGQYGVHLSEAYKEFCSQISFADFLVISAEAVINVTRQNALQDGMHHTSPTHPFFETLDFRSRFRYGRITAESCSESVGMMPDAEEGCAAVSGSLVGRMGLTWGQSAALMGAHTIGQASVDRSGYNGRWVEIEDSRRFNNRYYESILLKGWGPEKSVAGNPQRNQYKRIDIGVDNTNKELMLNTDMCLFYTLDGQETETSTKTCDCLWTRFSTENLEGAHKDLLANNNNVLCGLAQLFPAFGEVKEEIEGVHNPALRLESENTFNFTKQRLICCGMQEVLAFDDKIDCRKSGPAESYIDLFGNSEEAWLEIFVEAWSIATTKGYEKRGASPGQHNVYMESSLKKLVHDA